MLLYYVTFLKCPFSKPYMTPLRRKLFETGETLERAFPVLTQIGDNTDMSVLEDLSHRGPITKDETTTEEC